MSVGFIAGLLSFTALVKVVVPNKLAYSLISTVIIEPKKTSTCYSRTKTYDISVHLNQILIHSNPFK